VAEPFGIAALWRGVEMLLIVIVIQSALYEYRSPAKLLGDLVIMAGVALPFVVLFGLLMPLVDYYLAARRRRRPAQSFLNVNPARHGIIRRPPPLSSRGNGRTPMVKVASLVERAEYYRARARDVREIASSLPDEAARETLRAIADDYDRLAEAKDQMILTRAKCGSEAET